MNMVASARFKPSGALQVSKSRCGVASLYLCLGVSVVRPGTKARFTAFVRIAAVAHPTAPVIRSCVVYRSLPHMQAMGTRRACYEASLCVLGEANNNLLLD
jgi:hypothetical protein